MSLIPGKENVVKLASETMSSLSAKLIVQDLVERMRPTLETSLDLISRGRAALEPDKDAIGKSEARRTYALLDIVEVSLKSCLGNMSQNESAHPKYREILSAEQFWGVVSGVEVALQKLQAREVGAGSRKLNEVLRTVTEAYDTKTGLSEAA